MRPWCWWNLGGGDCVWGFWNGLETVEVVKDTQVFVGVKEPGISFDNAIVHHAKAFVRRKAFGKVFVA